ncbi:MAG TPA: (2Fe-2S)-binding protein [Thermomicrobiales bacterium]|nr:(2Fe-2S)-binding protein [Thermomicrobiales bacterium]
MDDSGSRRITRHPILGELPAADSVTFTFDGRSVLARADDTIASALLAHGIRRFRSMPETGAPRGYFCGAGRCMDCAVTVDGLLNVAACTTPVRAGMVVKTQHGLGTWGPS